MRVMEIRQVCGERYWLILLWREHGFLIRCREAVISAVDTNPSHHYNRTYELSMDSRK